MAETALATAAVHRSPSPEETAQLLIDTWCRMHARSVEEFDDLVKTKNGRRSLGILAYACRKEARIDIIPLSLMLKIPAAKVMMLSRDTHTDVEDLRAVDATKSLNALLAECGLRTPDERTMAQQDVIPDPLSKTVGANAGVSRFIAKQKEAERREVREQLWRDAADRIVRHISLLPYGRVFSLERTRDITEVRHVVLAVIYHAYDEDKNVASLRHCFGVSQNAGYRALAHVAASMKLPEMNPTKAKALAACDLLKIDPELLKKER